MSKGEVYWSLYTLFLLSALLIFLHSSYFSVEVIFLYENQYFSEEELLEGLELPIGENIFKVSRTSLSKALLSNSKINKVKIERRLPGTLLVTVEEQRPLTYIEQEGSMHLIGCRGMVIRSEEPPGTFLLPTIYGQTILPEERLPERVEEVIPLLLYFSPSFLSEVEGIEIFEDRISLSLPERVQVFVDWELTVGQAQMLQIIYQEIEDKGSLEYIDMRFGINPVIKYVNY